MRRLLKVTRSSSAPDTRGCRVAANKSDTFLLQRNGPSTFNSEPVTARRRHPDDYVRYDMCLKAQIQYRLVLACCLEAPCTGCCQNISIVVRDGFLQHWWFVMAFYSISGSRRLFTAALNFGADSTGHFRLCARQASFATDSTRLFRKCGEMGSQGTWGTPSGLG